MSVPNSVHGNPSNMRRYSTLNPRCEPYGGIRGKLTAKVISLHCLITINVCSKFMAVHLVDISQDDLKPAGCNRGGLGGSPESLWFIIWASLILYLHQISWKSLQYLLRYFSKSQNCQTAGGTRGRVSRVNGISPLGNMTVGTTLHGDPSNGSIEQHVFQCRKTGILTHTLCRACVFTACAECEGLKPILKQTTPASTSLSFFGLSLLLSHQLFQHFTTSGPSLQLQIHLWFTELSTAFRLLMTHGVLSMCLSVFLWTTVSRKLEILTSWHG